MHLSKLLTLEKKQVYHTYLSDLKVISSDYNPLWTHGFALQGLPSMSRSYYAVLDVLVGSL